MVLQRHESYRQAEIDLLRQAQFAKFERLSTSPGALKALQFVNMQIDVRSILPTVRVPTLVLHRATDEQVSVKFGRDLALQIPGANY